MLFEYFIGPIVAKLLSLQRGVKTALTYLLTLAILLAVFSVVFVNL